MTRWEVAIMIVGICAIGLLYLVYERRRLATRGQDAALFLQHVQDYLRSKGQDVESYGWLLRHSYAMQKDLGPFGVMGHIKPPFANYLIPNWPIVVNSLSEMRRWADQRSIGFSGPPEQFFEYGAILQEAIVTYAGVLEGETKESMSSMLNPFIWFRYGMQLIILLPLMILRWLGISKIPELRILSRKPGIKFIASVAAVVGFIGSIASIIAGWDSTVSFIKRLLAFVH